MIDTKEIKRIALYHEYNFPGMTIEVSTKFLIKICNELEEARMRLAKHERSEGCE